MTNPITYASWPMIPEPRDLPELQRRLAARDPRLEAAVAIAARAHAGQLRDGTDVPYLYHPLAVAALGLQVGLRELDDLATAVLHDALEDSDLTAADLAARLGSRVAEQVAALSKTKGQSEQYFARLAAAPPAVRLIKGLDRFHNLLTIPEDRRAKYVDETRASIMPLLGETPAERYVHRLLSQLAALREAGDRKLTLPADSDEGRRVLQALAKRARIDFERVYDRAELRRFERRADKDGRLIFMVAYVVTAPGQVALFERSTLRRAGSLTGRGLLTAVTPLPDWPTEVSAFRRLRCAPDAIREILPMGQGVSDVGAARYVFELFNVVLRAPEPVTLLSASDRFAGFVDLDGAGESLGAGRELDRDLLRHLQGDRAPLRLFAPTSVRTRIRERLFLGMDIVAFSSHDTYTQVAELLRLHRLLRAEVSAHTWREPLIFSPTGDGCFLSASPGDLPAVLALAGRLRQRIEQSNTETGRELQLRYGLNRGPAFSIVDINGAENLIGDGINLAARMLGGEAPWELNVRPETLGHGPALDAVPQPYRFEPAQLRIKHHPEPVDVLRTITPALAPNEARDGSDAPGAAPGPAVATPCSARTTPEEPPRDGGAPCECIRLSDWPSYEDYATTELDPGPLGGRDGELSLERCRGCGRAWLSYFYEEEQEPGSGRWYRCLLTDAQLVEVAGPGGRSGTLAGALAILRAAPWHQYGGSYYGGFGTTDGPPLLPGEARRQASGTGRAGSLPPTPAGPGPLGSVEPQRPEREPPESAPPESAELSPETEAILALFGPPEAERRRLLAQAREAGARAGKEPFDLDALEQLYDTSTDLGPATDREALAEALETRYYENDEIFTIEQFAEFLKLIEPYM